MKWAFIFIGSGVGGLLRYAISGWSQRVVHGVFPMGTLVVNVTGCFLIGFATAAFASRLIGREELRIGLLVGLLGGYTTFSTFGIETFSLANDGQLWRAGLNVLASVILGLVGVWIGFRLAESWLGVSS